jgi:hypothetical protein
MTCIDHLASSTRDIGRRRRPYTEQGRVLRRPACSPPFQLTAAETGPLSRAERAPSAPGPPAAKPAPHAPRGPECRPPLVQSSRPGPSSRAHTGGAPRRAQSPPSVEGRRAAVVDNRTRRARIMQRACRPPCGCAESRRALRDGTWRGGRRERRGGGVGGGGGISGRRSRSKRLSSREHEDDQCAGEVYHVAGARRKSRSTCPPASVGTNSAFEGALTSAIRPRAAFPPAPEVHPQGTVVRGWGRLVEGEPEDECWHRSRTVAWTALIVWVLFPHVSLRYVGPIGSWGWEFGAVG